MLSQLPEGLISKDTGRGLFSFVNNVPYEGQKVQKEQNSETELVNLDKVVDNDGEQ